MDLKNIPKTHMVEVLRQLIIKTEYCVIKCPFAYNSDIKCFSIKCVDRNIKKLLRDIGTYDRK